MENQEQENQQALQKVEGANGKDETYNQYVDDFRAQAQEYGARVQDAALKAKDYASEKFAAANEKFKELQGKEPQELLEDAKEYARKNPGQAILISAAAGLLLGWLLKRK
jgi:ElaB/YqjD/DUF883 family membrane-anchored ribosome-binding protein